ncbi:MAG TPA: MGMT family protein [Aggregatilineales bacterium]|nr:MGMT family protein [Aggregatilineales bacterium]
MNFNSPKFNAQVYTLVKLIPRGKLLSYGKVAALLGVPNGARQVGWAMAALPDDTDVPWQRVINAQGRISTRRRPGDERHQRERLDAEGVHFSEDGRVLPSHWWTPSQLEIEDLLRDKLSGPGE